MYLHPVLLLSGTPDWQIPARTVNNPNPLDGNQSNSRGEKHQHLTHSPPPPLRLADWAYGVILCSSLPSIFEDGLSSYANTKSSAIHRQNTEKGRFIDINNLLPVSVHLPILQTSSPDSDCWYVSGRRSGRSLFFLPFFPRSCFPRSWYLISPVRFPFVCQPLCFCGLALT